MGYRGFLGQTVDPGLACAPCPTRCSTRRRWPRHLRHRSSCCRSRRPRRDFFMVPGDKQVTILWRPTPSETQGDAYFAIANDPTQGCPVRSRLPAVRRRGLPDLSRPDRHAEPAGAGGAVRLHRHPDLRFPGHHQPQRRPADRSWASRGLRRAVPGHAAGATGPLHRLGRRRAHRADRSGPSRQARRPHQRHRPNQQRAECRGHAWSPAATPDSRNWPTPACRSSSPTTDRVS